jgi:hypothetical protein
MAPYRLVLSEQFAAECEQKKKEYPGCEAAFAVALQTIAQSADRCGVSTNRGLRYLGTRERVDAPGFWIFFDLDEAKETATLVPPVTEKPRTLTLAAESTEE